MSSRVTRSSAKKSADTVLPPPSGSLQHPPLGPEPSPSRAPPPQPASRKRTASARASPPPSQPGALNEQSSRRPKRPRYRAPDTTAVQTPPPSVAKGKGKAVMSASREALQDTLDEDIPSPPTTASSSSKRKSAKAKKSSPDQSGANVAHRAKPTSASSSKRSSRLAKTVSADQEPGTDAAEEDVHMSEEEDDDNEQDNNEADATPYGEDEDMSEDPFEASLFAHRHGVAGLSGTLRALSGFMGGGTSSRFAQILENLRRKTEPDVQMMALEELSNLLLMSTEDALAGRFSPEQFVKEVVPLMQPTDFGENPVMMLVACRCIANLIEALPAATTTVVYSGAVPALLGHLIAVTDLEISEQALITLEKISAEFPRSIVSEGGLAPCLSNLDFYTSSIQRTAVTIAANCARNLQPDAFSSVRDVMPKLLEVLSSNTDQKVVEQACLAVSRIVESYKEHDEKIEELMTPELLQAILRMILPGTTNLVSSHIHTQFLRVLSITARASAALTVQLFKLNIVDIAYQMLTGVSPPVGLDNVAQKIDSVLIMQALIHRPREQIFETLNVICELLPSYKKDSPDLIDEFFESTQLARDPSLSRARRGPAPQRKLEALRDCNDELKRFATLLFPTLTDAYSSTVNMSVRQKVLVAQLKMLSNLEPFILEGALRAVPYASFLASILSQHDQLLLVVPALQAAEILLSRLGDIYRPQFHREGVVAEIRKLAASATESPELNKILAAGSSIQATESQSRSEIPPAGIEDESAAEPNEDEDDDEDENENDEVEDVHEEDSDSSTSDHPPQPPIPVSRMSLLQDLVGRLARRFLAEHETEEDDRAKLDAADDLDGLQSLMARIQDAFDADDMKAANKGLMELAKHFEGDALKSITSYELLASKMVTSFLDMFQHEDGEPNETSRSAFREAFMNTSIKSMVKTAASDSPNTPFSVLVHKLQDLLSRAEHFEVITVHSQPMDSNRSSAASMLAKQIKIRLEADGESGIPAQYRNVMVSIHAIATFKALDDYLRPRITLAERPHSSRRREMVAALQAANAAAGETPKTPQAAPATQSSGSAETPTPALRDTRKALKSRQHTTVPGAVPDTSEHPPTGQTSSRRSARKTKFRGSPPRTPTTAAASTAGDPQQPLECADETQLDDDDDEDDEDDDELDDDEELDAIVGGLEDEADEELPDPSAVNMEVGSSGKVTALAEDGTRIATPTQHESSSRPPSGTRMLTSEAARSLLGSLPTRPMSYSAAVQATPQNWHLEFSVGGQPIGNETTIYRAVHSLQGKTDEVSTRGIWSNLHVINYKRVEGPPAASPITISQQYETAEDDASGHPSSLDKNPVTASILRLLQVLHDINSGVGDLPSSSLSSTIAPEPAAQFVNTKLTAKLNRQLEEPLIVASSCLPNWAEDLARIYPFLFPFETRHLFLQSTSFGYSRSMARWQNAQQTNETSSRHRHRDERPFLGRLQRQKVRISRRQILEAAIKVMELYGAYPHVLEIEYYEEVGTGLGPTLEFYSTVSKEFSKKKLRLWRDSDNTGDAEYAFGKNGLFPAPMSATQANTENGKKIIALFKALGKFVARSMLDSRIIDISFNPVFFKHQQGGVKTNTALVHSVDSSLANSLQTLKHFLVAKKKIEEQSKLTAAQKASKLSRVSVGNATIEDMALNFTLPGYNIDLIPGGSHTDVTLDNLELYIEKVIDFTVGEGVRRQIDAFRTGFSQVFPYKALRAFTPDELVMLFGRNEEDWSLETLSDAVKADHGFNVDSKSVRNLLKVMSSLSLSGRRDFLQFVTGSPKLPIGGFKSLTPMFTVVCKPAEAPFTSDDYLPSVMTCVNYLKLPDYTSYEVMEKRLDVAIREGQGAFHLS